LRGESSLRLPRGPKGGVLFLIWVVELVWVARLFFILFFLVGRRLQRRHRRCLPHRHRHHHRRRCRRHRLWRWRLRCRLNIKNVLLFVSETYEHFIILCSCCLSSAYVSISPVAQQLN